MEYISLDFDGMSKTIAELLGGIAVPVDTNGFANDLVTFQDRNDVLTLLIHLGYLAFDKGTKTARIPNEEIAPLFYNNEQALRSVIKLAYFSYKDYYLKFEELPSGDGYANIVYLPKKSSPMPALVIELKWDLAAQGAISQIREQRYPAALSGYGGSILLIGISYARDTKGTKRKHTCMIEKLQI
ncbi:MAG: PD-(D/E)XK nuclease domain-containing protein [Lachnospiraceae bacterium]